MKPLTDYSWVRGVNHYQCGEEQLRRELGYGKRVNLNAVRIWLDRGWYERNPEKYIADLVNYVRICYDCGYQVMPILFNGNFLDPETLTETYYERNYAFARAVVHALKDEPGLLMWDIMNEPACNNWTYANDIDETEKKRRYDLLWAFLRKYSAFVKELDPVNATTIGHTTAWEIEPTADCVDVLSFHDYSGTRKNLYDNYGLADKLSKKYGKPVMQTETGCLARCNPYDVTLQACEKYKMGWFVYELIIHGRCDSEHGVFYPDGTVRDPATIAAMMGCYRCRDLDVMVVPIPNREGQGQRCVDDIKRALTEYTCDAFDYRPSDIAQLLDACERAANLLECCDMIPMACPPTARIFAWRKMERPPLAEIRRFAYELAKQMQDICELL
jgi:hypothetical protein